MSEAIEWMNARERVSIPPKREKPIDKEISKLVGKDIRTTDPRLIKLIVKWKSEENKADDSKVNSNYLEDPEKVKELINTFK